MFRSPASLLHKALSWCSSPNIAQHEMSGLALFLVSICIIFTQFNNYPFHETDLIAYHLAEHLFLEGKNPYDIELMRQAQESYGRTESPKMVWNPPSIFVTLALPCFGRPNLIRILWAAILPLAALYIAYFGWGLGRSSLSLRYELHSSMFFLLAICCSIPFWAGVWLLQMSSVLIALGLWGIHSYLDNKDLRAGILLSMLVLKPYILFLPVALILFDSLYQKRWRLWSGLLIGTLLPLCLAELFHPGVFQQWVYKESWPTFIFGSTISSFARAFLYTSYNFDSLFLALCISLLALILFFIEYLKRGLSRSLFVTALASSLLFAPYGFSHDQVSTIAVHTYLLQNAAERGKNQLRFVVASIVGTVLLSALFVRTELFGLPVIWLSPSLVTLLTLLLYLRYFPIVGESAV